MLRFTPTDRLIDLSRALALSAVLCMTTTSFADYRAHLLQIRNVDSGTEREVVSTLDHLQYREYFPVSGREEILLVTSWRCPGRTSHFKRICPRPEGLGASDQGPNLAPVRPQTR